MDSSFSIPAHHQSIDRVHLGILNSNVKVLFMDDDKQQQLEEQFQALFAEGKAFPGRRPKIDNAIARLLINNQGFLAQSKFSSPRFEEGWFSFMNSFWSNLWEICPNSRTESAYCDSEVAINRFRFTLHRRIKGAEMKKTDLSLNAPIGGDGGYILLDQIAAPTQNNNYAELKQAVEEDITGEFSGTKMRSQPHINAQSCLLLYFELEDWMKVARQLGSDDISDFTSFVSSFNSFRPHRCKNPCTKRWVR